MVVIFKLLHCLIVVGWFGRLVGWYGLVGWLVGWCGLVGWLVGMVWLVS
jgi:hypothetical protein